MSNDNAQWFYEDLILTPMNAESAVDAITQLGTLLEKGGFVKESFVPAVIKREQEFATGLPTAEVGVAIPHTDIEHVLKQAIAIGVLKNPVEFGEMGNPGSTVPVQIVCLLAVAKSEILVKILQSLVEMFQTPGLLKQIVQAKNSSEIIKIFQQYCQVE
ncbi:MAG: PTS sugar transporter subunit IIA [Anaerolineae bacterium]